MVSCRVNVSGLLGPFGKSFTVTAPEETDTTRPVSCTVAKLPGPLLGRAGEVLRVLDGFIFV